MKSYILKRISDGSVSICKGPLIIPPGYEFYKEASELYPVPTDRRFRSAWVIKNGQIKVDMAKARVIKKDALMAIRDVKMAENAAEFNLKLSLGQSTSEISSKQERLNELESLINSDLAKKRSVSTIDSYDPFTEYDL